MFCTPSERNCPEVHFSTLKTENDLTGEGMGAVGSAESQSIFFAVMLC